MSRTRLRRQPSLSEQQAQNDAVERVREAKTRIELAEKAEKEAIARLPYTREELQAVLDELGQRAKQKAGVVAPVPKPLKNQAGSAEPKR